MTRMNPSGCGTKRDSYRIQTLENLRWLSETESAWNSHFIQTADIDARETKNWNLLHGESLGFLPIGFSESEGIFRFFMGRYNGEGHCIRGLYIYRRDSFRVGLFGHTWKATLENIRLTDVLVGWNDHSWIRESENRESLVGNAGDDDVSEMLQTVVPLLPLTEVGSKGIYITDRNRKE
jgi:hypothetical protein